MPTIRTAFTIIFIAAIALVALSACETSPPVQEMSDARQAIAVAREAGAAERASQELEMAEMHLKQAENDLGKQRYGEARLAAEQARDIAHAALKLVSGSSDNDSRYP